MIDLNQETKIKWSTRSKKKFTDLGYEFTGFSEYFSVKVGDLDLNSNARVTVYCDECGIEMETMYNNYNKIVSKSGAYRCRKCNAKYTSQTRINNHAEIGFNYFTTKIKELGYEPIATIEDYKGHDVGMKFICDKHGEQELSVSQLRQGCICHECGLENRSEFFRLDFNRIREIVHSKNNNTLLNAEEYSEMSKKNMKVKCGSCGNVFITSIASISSSNGSCGECGFVKSQESRRKSTKERVADEYKNVLINPDDYVDSVSRNLLFKCSCCGEPFLQSSSKYSSGYTRCKKCVSNESLGEMNVRKFLESHGYAYEQQKRFRDCKRIKPLPFDFYLPDHNCCIEFDGIQHYVKMAYDSDETYKIRRDRDKIKDKYCADNGIKLIRIPYLEFKNIDSILSKEIA